MEKPIFSNPAQAINAIWPFIPRLAHRWAWTAVAVANLALLYLLMAVMWWWQVTPAAVQTTVLQTLQSTSAVVLGAAGLSGSVLLSAYVWLLRKVVGLLGNRLFEEATEHMR